MADLEEALAHQQLARQGSVMTRPQQVPEVTGNTTIDPILAAIGSVLNAFGPTPVDAFAGKAAELAGHAGLGQLLGALLGMGGEQPGNTDAGIYRQLGMQRAGGLLNPAEYLQRLQELPNYQRYLQLVQGMVKRGLGEQFPVARGKSQTDPLIRALMAGQAGTELPSTAVSYAKAVPGSTSFTTGSGPGMHDIAEGFAQAEAYKTRKPTYVAQGTATPADVAALVPRRQAYGHEAELVLQPTASFAPQLTAKYVPPSSQFPWVERKALNMQPSADPVTAELMQALAEAAKPPH